MLYTDGGNSSAKKGRHPSFPEPPSIISAKSLKLKDKKSDDEVKEFLFPTGTSSSSISSTSSSSDDENVADDTENDDVNSTFPEADDDAKDLFKVRQNIYIICRSISLLRIHYYWHDINFPDFIGLSICHSLFI